MLYTALVLWQHAYLNEGEVRLVSRMLISIKHLIFFSFHTFKERFLRWIQPPTTSLLLGTLTDLARGKSELLAENALLRQQLNILRRQVKRPIYRKTDRFLLLLLTRTVRRWKQALFLAQPETLLRWHRELFRLFWKRKSKARSKRSSSSRRWRQTTGVFRAERIRGELLKLDIRRSQTDHSKV
jgi:hypothetical protein